MAGANVLDVTATEIERNLKSQRSLALYRIQLLEYDSASDDDTAIGLPSLFSPLLRHSIDQFITAISNIHNDEKQITFLPEAMETTNLVRMLKIYRRISELDSVLDEEIGQQGAHHSLSKIIKLDIHSIDCCRTEDDNINERNQDMIIEIQDMACEIASFSKTFPLQMSPFVRDDLRSRLPLVFDIFPITQSVTSENGCKKDEVKILINQVTDRQSAQKDVGYVMWPSAVVLSRWLVTNPTELRGKTVLELGAGCGLTGLVAAKIMHSYTNQDSNKLSPTETTPSKTLSDCGGVILSDFNKTVIKNLKGNIGLNGLDEMATVDGLDFYQQDPDGKGWLTIDGVKRTGLADIILAADVICQPEDAFALARSISSALREGCKAIVVSADSKHRFGVEKLEEACRTVGCLSILSKSKVDDYLYNRDSDSISRDEDMEKTSGFVNGMSLTMYTIVKTSKL